MERSPSLEVDWGVAAPSSSGSPSRPSMADPASPMRVAPARVPKPVRVGASPDRFQPLLAFWRRVGVRMVAGLAIAGMLLSVWPLTQSVLKWKHRQNALDDLENIRHVLSPTGHFLGVASGRLDPGDAMGYFLREELEDGPPSYPTRDPWEHRYRVRFALEKKEFVLFSAGPDGVPGSCETEMPPGDDLCIGL